MLTRLSLDDRRRIDYSVVFSVLAHSLLLMLPLSVGGGRDGSVVVPQARSITIDIAPARAQDLLKQAAAVPESPISGITPVPDAVVELQDENVSGAQGLPHGWSGPTGDPVAGEQSGDYLPSLSLSKRPRPLETPRLEDAEIRTRRDSGRILLTLWISSSGIVERVQIEENELTAMYASLTKRAFLATRFSPGEEGGLPVNSMMTVEVTYHSSRLPDVSENVREQHNDRSDYRH